MRGADDEVAAMAVLEAEELGAVDVPAAGLLPDLARDDHRDEDLLGADGVHLLADDGLDLHERAPGERQVAVEAGGGLADHAGAQQQAMASELGLGGILLEGGCVGPAHQFVTCHDGSSRRYAVHG